MVVVTAAAMAPDRAVVMVLMSSAVNDPFAMLPTRPLPLPKMVAMLLATSVAFSGYAAWSLETPLVKAMQMGAVTLAIPRTPA